MTLGDEKFTGVSSLNDYLIMSNLENNLQSFLDWGFLNIGGFTNINNTPTDYSNNPNELGLVYDPNYYDGQVWQTRFSNWVWESGISFSGSSPTEISAVMVNNVPATTGSYVLDYANSRVLFNNSVPTNSSVTMNYSYKTIQIYKASDNLVWWKQFQLDMANETASFDDNTGDYAIFSQHRVRLPCIIIEMVPRGTAEPYRLGDKSLMTYQDIILHIIAPNASYRNSLVDIIRLQQDKVIWLYDTSILIDNNLLPYNFNGSLNTNRINYGQLVNNILYQWKTCQLQNFIVSEVESRYYFEEAKIRLTAEIIFDTL